MTYRSFTFEQLITLFPYLNTFKTNDVINGLDPVLNFLDGVLVVNNEKTMLHKFDFMFLSPAGAKFVFKRTFDYDEKLPEKEQKNVNIDEKQQNESKIGQRAPSDTHQNQTGIRERRKYYP